MTNALELARGSSPPEFAVRFLMQPRTVQVACLEQLARAVPAIDRAAAYLARLESGLKERDAA